MLVFVSTKMISVRVTVRILVIGVKMVAKESSRKNLGQSQEIHGQALSQHQSLVRSPHPVREDLREVLDFLNHGPESLFLVFEKR